MVVPETIELDAGEQLPPSVQVDPFTEIEELMVPNTPELSYKTFPLVPLFTVVVPENLELADAVGEHDEPSVHVVPFTVNEEFVRPEFGIVETEDTRPEPLIVK